MQTVIGDIWDVALNYQNCAVCVPTNEGYTKMLNNVMGAGLAKQAAKRFPMLPSQYGNWLSKGNSGIWVCNTPSSSPKSLIMVPVKPRIDPPHLSWKQPADICLVEQSIVQLAGANWPYGLLLVVPFGCGNGGLSQDDVLPIMRRNLTDDKYILVMKDGS